MKPPRRKHSHRIPEPISGPCTQIEDRRDMGPALEQLGAIHRLNRVERNSAHRAAETQLACEGPPAERCLSSHPKPILVDGNARSLGLPSWAQERDVSHKPNAHKLPPKVERGSEAQTNTLIPSR